MGEYFAAEQPLLSRCLASRSRPAGGPAHGWTRYGQVSIRTNRYSVPVRLIGRQVRVLLHASEVVVYDGRTEVARHERLVAKGGVRLDLDHYLEALLRKRGALPGTTALDQARAAGRFTPVHDAWWEAVRKAHGDAAGTRTLIEVLLLHRHMAHEHVVAGIAAALQVGALTADAVALEARKAADADHPPACRHPATAVAGRLGRAAATPARHRPSQRRSAVTAQRHRGLTEQAADAAIDSACCGCPRSGPSFPTSPLRPPASR